MGHNLILSPNFVSPSGLPQIIVSWRPCELRRDFTNSFCNKSVQFVQCVQCCTVCTLRLIVRLYTFLLCRCRSYCRTPRTPALQSLSSSTTITVSDKTLPNCRRLDSLSTRFVRAYYHRHHRHHRRHHTSVYRQADVGDALIHTYIHTIKVKNATHFRLSHFTVEE